MFGMSLISAQANFFDRDLVVKKVAAAERRNLSRFGSFVRRRAKSSIRRRKRISEAGQPPSSHAGQLRDMIFFAYEPKRSSVIIGPVRLNGKQEGIPQALEYGGPSQSISGGRRGRKRVRRFTVKARPFMRPAFETEKEKLPALWANSVK